MSVEYCYKQYVDDGMETSLPKGRNVMGRKWVYALKEHAKNGKIFQASYVAKGYNQTEEIDCSETVVPTANITLLEVKGS